MNAEEDCHGVAVLQHIGGQFQREFAGDGHRILHLLFCRRKHFAFQHGGNQVNEPPGQVVARAFGRLRGLSDAKEGVITLIEEWLAKHRRTLKPDKKARVIRLAYEHCIAKGEVDAAHLRDMLSIAA